ncbi:MAG: ABC transporter ATP-binding protein [Bacteroidetes bacterium]|nr:MAG: ABC transporter ATP-binding protein [Bacteroidota bacterium]
MQPIIKIENLSKMYRLGVIGTGTISHDLNRWWHKVRGKEDPYLKIGEANVSSSKSDSGYVWALKDISLEVMPGEVLGIIGKNGAGKSTLLKILSRVTGPTTGKISYRGRIGSLLEVGTGFHGELTGRENIFLNGAILGMTKAEIRSKMDEIVNFAGIERYIDTPVKRYSSGMKVRLGFAVAAHLEPEILVVDEVLAVGDAEFQKKAIGKMQDISSNEGRTILFVSHNMGSIQKLCSKSVILENGQIIYSGDVIQSIKTYNDSKSKEIYQTERKENFSKPYILKAWFTDEIDKKIDYLVSGENLKLHFEISNSQKDELEVQLSFWDGFGNMLWNFTHQSYNTPPLPPQEKLHVSISFNIPYIIVDEIFVHIGISAKGETAYGMIENNINALSINVLNKEKELSKNFFGIFKAQATLKLHEDF